MRNGNKLPPFGKRLDAHAREVWIYVGTDAWHSASTRSGRKLPVLLLPPDQDPERFRWPVAGKEVLLLQQGHYDFQQIPAFANLLFKCGAVAVRAIYGDGQVVYYTGEVHEAA